MGGAGSAKEGTQASRLFYGFFTWKAKADSVAQWVYRHNAIPDHNYAWPAQDASRSKVPTLRWEAVREGAKDCRYLATLEKLIAGNQGQVSKQAWKGEFSAEPITILNCRHGCLRSQAGFIAEVASPV